MDGILCTLYDIVAFAIYVTSLWEKKILISVWMALLPCSSLLV